MQGARRYRPAMSAYSKGPQWQSWHAASVSANFVSTVRRNSVRSEKMYLPPQQSDLRIAAGEYTTSRKRIESDPSAVALVPKPDQQSSGPMRKIEARGQAASSQLSGGPYPPALAEWQSMSPALERLALRTAGLRFACRVGRRPQCRHPAAAQRQESETGHRDSVTAHIRSSARSAD